MAVDLLSPPISPSTRAAVAPAAAPEDLAGVRFLWSVGGAGLAAAWGAWLGSMVESAVMESPESRVGALIAAVVLTACGAALGCVRAARYGVGEATGRALMDGIPFAWQGAWLGGLIGGGVAAAHGGGWVVLLAFGAVAVGGLAGCAVGARLHGKDLRKIVQGVLWGGVLAGFGASFLWAPATTGGDPPAAAAAFFGPQADGMWRGAAAAPLVVAAFVWWLRWMREGRTKGGEQAVGWGMGAAAFVFVAAMAAGAGAIVGGLTQLVCGYLVAHCSLNPTPGTWVGALVALFFWGWGRQPKRPPVAG